MKIKHKLSVALLAFACFAKPHTDLKADILDDVGLSNDFADISIMARPRFEYREVDGLEGSESVTFRL